MSIYKTIKSPGQEQMQFGFLINCTLNSVIKDNIFQQYESYFQISGELVDQIHMTEALFKREQLLPFQGWPAQQLHAEILQPLEYWKRRLPQPRMPRWKSTNSPAT